MVQESFPMIVGGDEVLNERDLLTRVENGMDLTEDTLFLCDGPEDLGLPPAPAVRERMCAGPRIGVDYAEEARDFLWRFWLEKET